MNGASPETDRQVLGPSRQDDRTGRDIPFGADHMESMAATCANDSRAAAAVSATVLPSASICRTKACFGASIGQAPSRIARPQPPHCDALRLTCRSK